MLNKNKILMMAVIGAIANLPGANAQTFYQCMPCGAGSYDNNGVCTKCPAGKYSEYSSQSSCTNCPAGTHASTSGSKKCLQCPAGTYSGSGATSCTHCSAGTYSDVVGATSSSVCKKCPAGTYSQGGATSCTPCPDYKMSGEGATNCRDIYYKICYYHKNPPANAYVWRIAGVTYDCSNTAMGWDPNKGEKKYCGIRINGCGRYVYDLASEGKKFNLNCKSLPCKFYDDGEKYYQFNPDKSLDICKKNCKWGGYDDDEWICSDNYECENYPDQLY